MIKMRYILFFIFPLILFSNELIKRDKQILSLITENDAYFEPFIKSDRYYTAGHYLSYTSKEFDDSFMNKIAVFSHFYDKSLSSFSVSLNQEIYTPEDKHRIPLKKDDALFGGYLYANITISNRADEFLEQIGFDIGVVGPYALGRQVQNGVHKITNNRQVEGWKYQIKNEFIMNFYYNIIYRLNLFDNIFDISPNFLLSLGNANIYADAGIKLRIGYGLNNDFAIPSVRNRIVSNTIEDGFRIYLLGGLKYKFVGRNIFLEGNTIRGVKGNLSLNRMIYEMEIGALIGYKNFAISYLFTNRQKEFKTQSTNHTYGSIRFEISF